MKYTLLVIITIAISTLAACTKTKSSYSYTHTQKYNTCNYTFNNSNYHVSTDSVGNSLVATFEKGTLFFGDTLQPSKKLSISCINNKYVVNIIANKRDLSTQAGMYKTGQVWGTDANTYYFGEVQIIDRDEDYRYFTNITEDTSSSYVNITEGSDHHIKGTFYLKCVVRSTDSVHNCSGDFDIYF